MRAVDVQMATIFAKVRLHNDAIHLEVYDPYPTQHRHHSHCQEEHCVLKNLSLLFPMIIQAHRLQEYFYFEHIDNKDVETQCHYIRGKKVQEFKDQIHRVPIFLINDGVEDPGDQIEATSRYVDIDEKLRFRVE